MAGPSAIFSALYNDPSCPTQGFMDGMVNIDDMIRYDTKWYMLRYVYTSMLLQMYIKYTV